jgi:hypothetical protein
MGWGCRFVRYFDEAVVRNISGDGRLMNFSMLEETEEILQSGTGGIMPNLTTGISL